VKLNGKLKVVVVSDSAFKAQDLRGLVMRGFLVLLMEDTAELVSGRTLRCQVLDWISRKHVHVTRSTYAAELHTLLDAINQGLLLNLCFTEIHWGAVPATELLSWTSACKQALPMDAGVDAKSVFDSVTAETVRTPADRHLLLHALAVREFLDDGRLRRLYWLDTVDMMADGLTKGAVDRAALIAATSHGEWHLTGDQPVCWPPL